MVLSHERANGAMQVYERERKLYGDVAGKVGAGLPDVEVLAVELAGPQRFCVYIDHPAGVDHALCERVTSVLREYLDQYTIDVSSPGFERPLRTREHFTAVEGRRVSVRTAHEIDGKRRFRGEVASAADDALLLATGATRVEIPYEEIVRANLMDEGHGHE